MKTRLLLAAAVVILTGLTGGCRTPEPPPLPEPRWDDAASMERWAEAWGNYQKAAAEADEAKLATQLLKL